MKENYSVLENVDKGWYKCEVFYAFKNMITEGATALKGVVEMGRVLKGDPTRCYATTDGGGDRRMNFLSVEKSLIALFLVHDWF